MTEKSHVALTRCFYCGEPYKILLATHYNQKGEPIRDLKPADGKVVDMDPCQECQGWMKQGIVLIGIEEAKCAPGWNKPKPDEKNWMPDPWRSGAFSVLREEAFVRIFPPEFHKFALEHRWMFIEHEAMVRLGFVEEEEEPRVCPSCKSKGFPVSTLSDDRCTFCDGTEGGHEPSVTTALEDQEKEGSDE